LFYRLVGWLCDARNIRSLDNDIDPKIADGVRLLEQTYLENLPITKFSEASHMSINAFRSLFKKQFGTSPVKYRNELRIERAKELLLEGGFTIAEVAYACGFENVGYFCRYYRRSMGETPSQTKDSN
jgi:AraC-like DNA-binding protein